MNILLLIIILLIVLIDLIPKLYLISSRIGIGKFLNKSIWINKVQNKTIKWIKNTPTVKLTDNKRLIVIDILKRNHRRKTIQQWQEAPLLLGLIADYENNEDKQIKTEINAYLNRKINKEGQWVDLQEETDSIILAYAIMKIDWIDYKLIKPAMDHSWSIIKNLVGEDGTVAYKKHNPLLRFVDTIGFICPFLMAYGIKYNKKEAINLSLKQIYEFNKYGIANGSFIPYHTYSIDNNLPVGLFGWGRGLGWYAIGLIDAWNELPEESPEKQKLTKSVYSFAKMAIRLQNENGSWNWLVTHKKSISETSATATLAWFLANLPKEFELYRESILAKNKALDFLMKNTRKNGAIDHSQGNVNGVGFHSTNFDILPFTQGFALRVICK